MPVIIDVTVPRLTAPYRDAISTPKFVDASVGLDAEANEPETAITAKALGAGMLTLAYRMNVRDPQIREAIADATAALVKALSDPVAH